MLYELKDIDNSMVEEQIFDSYIDYTNDLFVELYPKDPIPPKEYTKLRMITKIPGEKNYRRVLLIEGKICAHYFMKIRTEESPEYEKNKNIADLFLLVRKELNYIKYAKILLLDAIEKLKKFEVIDTIETCCYRNRVKNFWENLEAKVAIEGAQSRLYLEEVDWSMVEEWRRKGHKLAKKENIELIEFDKCPAEIIEKYAKLYTDIMNLVPIGDFEWRPAVLTPKKIRESEERFDKLGYKWLTFVTKESNGELSGITEIFYHPARPHYVEQELTGVNLDFRGRGLGKWLKAEMLELVRIRYPDVKYIMTDNANSNAPMLSINERLGFQRYLEEKCYSIKIANIDL